jgi:hypothetical protein
MCIAGGKIVCLTYGFSWTIGKNERIQFDQQYGDALRVRAIMDRRPVLSNVCNPFYRRRPGADYESDPVNLGRMHFRFPLNRFAKFVVPEFTRLNR